MSSLESDRLSCSDLVGSFDLVGKDVFFTAFEKYTSGFFFSLRSFRTACSLGMRYFVSLLNSGQFLENA